MGRSEILRGWRRRFAAAGVLATASLTLAGTALGQPTRVGPRLYPKPVDGTTRRFSAVAYDAANDVYVVAWGLGTVGIRYVSAAGTPIGVPANINTATSGPPGYCLRRQPEHVPGGLDPGARVDHWPSDPLQRGHGAGPDFDVRHQQQRKEQADRPRRLMWRTRRWLANFSSRGPSSTAPLEDRTFTASASARSPPRWVPR